MSKLEDWVITITFDKSSLNATAARIEELRRKFNDDEKLEQVLTVADIIGLDGNLSDHMFVVTGSTVWVDFTRLDYILNAFEAGVYD